MKKDINYFYNGKKLQKLFQEGIKPLETQEKNSQKLKWKSTEIKTL